MNINPNKEKTVQPQDMFPIIEGDHELVLPNLEGPGPDRGTLSDQDLVGKIVQWVKTGQQTDLRITIRINLYEADRNWRCLLRDALEMEICLLPRDTKPENIIETLHGWRKAVIHMMEHWDITMPSVLSQWSAALHPAALDMARYRRVLRNKNQTSEAIFNSLVSGSNMGRYL